MKNDNERWETKFEDLLYEIMASKDAYEKLRVANKYPLKNTFFEYQARQRTAFGQILADEIHVVTNRKPQIDYEDERRIFIPIPEVLLEGKMSSIETDQWVAQKEQELIYRYQDLLLHIELPNTTSAILQSQAGQLNNQLKKLEIDLKIYSRADRGTFIETTQAKREF